MLPLLGDTSWPSESAPGIYPPRLFRLRGGELKNKPERKLSSLQVSNFQSFGPAMMEISFEDVTHLLGPNGAGKTAALQVLCRMLHLNPI